MYICIIPLENMLALFIKAEVVQNLQTTESIPQLTQQDILYMYSASRASFWGAAGLHPREFPK